MVLKENEEHKILKEEIEIKMKNWEEERESSNNIIHELSLEVSLHPSVWPRYFSIHYERVGNFYHIT